MVLPTARTHQVFFPLFRQILRVLAPLFGKLESPDYLNMSHVRNRTRLCICNSFHSCSLPSAVITGLLFFVCPVPETLTMIVVVP